ncbi:TIGR03118 family protein [Acrocarpospora catenulata]|uniref:TIGR03118 family protein n=1 Tax=Acrocarpospora catenulata TaxID=2836182 RepID=UPI001BDB2A45|nr:TIGR03118 family protein [Acrocarpospora catenulata]
MRSRIAVLCAGALILSTVPGTAHAASAPLSPVLAGGKLGKVTATRFSQVNLVSDVAGQASVTDPKLVNPWGLAMGKTLWVSGTGTGVATVYSGAVKKEQTEVAIPGGAPTGQVVNTGQDFTVKGKPATFIFASPSGAITGWNAEVDPKNAIIAAFTRGADYKGLALMTTNRGSFLLAPSFSHGRIHVFDEDFARVRLARWQFRDPRLPRGYSPWNVEVVGNSVLVAYALRDATTGKAVPGKGKGFISQFTPDGRFVGRFAARGALNAPWAMTLAPRGFGGFSGALLVGNFGDGWVNAYNPRNGRYLGPLRKADGSPIAIEGLWDLERGTAANGGENAIWFSAGIQKAQHGLLGLLRPATASSAGTGASATPTVTPSATPSKAGGSSYGY